MKKFLHTAWGTSVLLLSSIIFPTQINAQDGGAPFSELGISVGPSNFLGDLGGNLGKAYCHSSFSRVVGKE